MKDSQKESFDDMISKLFKYKFREMEGEPIYQLDTPNGSLMFNCIDISGETLILKNEIDEVADGYPFAPVGEFKINSEFDFPFDEILKKVPRNDWLGEGTKFGIIEGSAEVNDRGMIETEPKYELVEIEENGVRIKDLEEKEDFELLIGQVLTEGEGQKHWLRRTKEGEWAVFQALHKLYERYEG